MAIGLMAMLLALPGGAASAVAQNNSLPAIVAAAAASGGEVKTADQIGAPERYTTTAANSNATMTLTADAALLIPDVDAIPVLGVQKAPISQTQVDALVKQLVKGELCSADAYIPSKEHLQWKLDLYQNAMQSPPAVDQKTKKPFSPETYLSTVEEIKAQLQTAGDEPRLMPIPGQLSGFYRPLRYVEGTYQASQYETGEQLNALAYSEATGYETLTVFNSDALTNMVIYSRMPDDFSTNMGGYSPITEDTDLTGSVPLAISEEQAAQTAGALMQTLGIDYMDLAQADKALGGVTLGSLPNSPEPNRQVWLMRYTRTASGVPTTYTSMECGKVETDGQADPIAYESMTFAIDDSGIVGYMWLSPYEITSTEAPSAKLLSFEECANVFETMVFPVDEWMAENGSAAIHVTRVKLGMTRVTEKDVRGKGLLIPVWDFFGDVAMSYESNGQQRQMKLDNEDLLTVNAVTGDVINRSLGY